MDSQADKEDDENMVCIPEQLIGGLSDELCRGSDDQDQSQRDHQASAACYCCQQSSDCVLRDTNVIAFLS